MRLLNVKTRKLEEYFDKIPKYLILSHRWGREEVSLQDLGSPAHQHLRGYAKVDRFCLLAARHGFDFVWIDTCCIDKTSSAELSEAINSMFRWYENASACYAYLDDVVADVEDISKDEVARPYLDIRLAQFYPFRKSLWFTRGWTLQELLAPRDVHFFDRSWMWFGNRSSLANTINAATNIPISYLCKKQDFRAASIAVRMSWAARRETTRIEDRAYALLGIFNVNMPLLYGEGDRAFERLQQELMKFNPDESVLAWSPFQVTLKRFPCSHDRRFRKDAQFLLKDSESIDFRFPEPQKERESQLNERAFSREAKIISRQSRPPRLLAQSPKEFICWANTIVTPTGEASLVPEMTSRGLRITLPVFQFEERVDPVVYGLLNCQIGTNFRRVVGIPLLQTALNDEYSRPCQPPRLLDLEWSAARQMKHRTIYIKKDEQDNGLENPVWNTNFKCGFVRLDVASNIPECLVEVTPEEADKRQWTSICPVPGIDHSWKRTLLHYSNDDAKDDGFVIVLERRSFVRAMFSCTMLPPPFVCCIVSKTKGKSLEYMAKTLDVSKANDFIMCKDGPRKVEVKRAAFLKHEMFVVTISRCGPNSLSSRFTGWVVDGILFAALPQRVFARYGTALDAAASYLYKSCVFSWREFYFVPFTIFSWILLSNTVSKGDVLQLAGLALSYFAIRLKARHAAHAICVWKDDTLESKVAYHYWPLDLAFVICFTAIDVFVYLRCYRRGEGNNALLGHHLLLISIWGQKPRTLGTPWRLWLNATWLQFLVFATFSSAGFLLTLAFCGAFGGVVANTR